MSERYKLYESKGEKLERKRKFCPKCGEGVYMASHADRDTCGKCGYTEFRKKTEAPTAPAAVQKRVPRKEKPKTDEK